MITAYLAHGLDDQPNGCPKADQCERHLILREHRADNEDEVLVGSVCQERSFQLFVEVGNERN